MANYHPGGWGDLPWADNIFTGPVSYVQVANGANPSGGQAVTASSFGFKSPMFLMIPVRASSSGTYTVDCIQVPGTNMSSVNWIFRWKVSATGAEVAAGTNLSGETVKVMAVAPY